VDPLADSTGQPYSYANDNPADGADPSGLCTLHGKRGTYNLAGVGGGGPCTRPELRGFITQFAGRNASPEQLDQAVQRVIDEVAAGQPSAAEPLDPGQGITPGQQAEAVRVSETGGGRVLLSGALEAVGIVLEAVGAVCAAFVAAVAAVPAAVVITIGVVVLASGLVVVTAITAPARGSTAGEITPVPNPTPNPTATATATATATPQPNLPIFYVYKAITRVIWRNDANAIRNDGYPSLLHYDPDRQRNRQRRGAACNQRRKVQLRVVPGVSSCDEYPFALSVEGGLYNGRLARTVLAPQAEQQQQAGDLGTFVTRNRLTFLSPFLVQPVP